jgi:transposase, IS6 family
VQCFGKVGRFYYKIARAKDDRPVNPNRIRKSVGGETSSLAAQTELRQVKYSNNVIEQDHRNIKRIVKPMLGLKFFNSARQTLRGIEATNMICKGQVQGIEEDDVRSQAEFVSQIFELIA